MTPSCVIVSVEARADTIAVGWSDGFVDQVTATWLRDACHCERCRGPDGGQRRFDPADLPPGQTTTSVSVTAEGLAAVFADGHRGTVPAGQLGRRRHGPPRATWDARHAGPLRTRAPRHDGELTVFLSDLDRFGVAMVTDVPAEPGWVTRFGERIGYVRETNYGRRFDVAAEPDPANLANSTLGLPVHTDNPYREPVPTVQLLHCIRAGGTGGATLLVDGFAAGERLAASDREAFELLTGRDVPFRYADGAVDLRARGRLIELDDGGDVAAVRVNSRSMEPPDLPAGELDAFYAAYRAFVVELARPEATVELSLRPGDLLALDNRRTLHGRSRYPAGSERLLQGCYLDIDAIRSTVRLSEAAGR